MQGLLFQFVLDADADAAGHGGAISASPRHLASLMTLPEMTVIIFHGQLSSDQGGFWFLPAAPGALREAGCSGGAEFGNGSFLAPSPVMDLGPQRARHR